jgi:serine/threonine protein kinase
MPLTQAEIDANVPIFTGIIKKPEGSERLSGGGCGIIYTLPSRPGQVLKVPRPFPNYEHDLEIEKKCLSRLGIHRNLVQVIEMDEYGIWLKRAYYGNLREYLSAGNDVSLKQRIIWCRDVAQVVHYVHQHGIRHADVSGRNLLVEQNLNVLLCDFSGSYIDGEKATIVAEGGFRHPDRAEYLLPTLRSELHSLGSTIYELITGAKPFKDLGGEEVQKLLEDGTYPDVSRLVLGDIISRCWRGEYQSSAEVAEAVSLTGKLKSRPWIDRTRAVELLIAFTFILFVSKAILYP